MIRSLEGRGGMPSMARDDYDGPGRRVQGFGELCTRGNKVDDNRGEAWRERGTRIEHLELHHAGMIAVSAESLSLLSPGIILKIATAYTTV